MNPDIQIQQVLEWAYNFVNFMNQPNGGFLVFCLVLPALSLVVTVASELLKKLIQAVNLEADEEEKRKNDKPKNEELVLEEEKPKRGRMMIGDDGELLEIVEEEFEE